MTGAQVVRRGLAAMPATTVVVLASLLLGVGPALAHASLKSSAPSNGATLADAPHEVELRFTTAINPASVTIAVRDAGGAAATARAADGVPGETHDRPLRR